MAFPTQQWQAQGACRGHDPDLWFSPRNSAAGREARRICATECPVAAECHLAALSQPERYGTWGGLDEDAREPLVRQRPRAVADSAPSRPTLSGHRGRSNNQQAIRRAATRSKYGRAVTGPRPRIAR